MGLFDTMFGGAGVYKDMMDPEMMKQIQQQSQLAMAAQLLAAGGPSTTRTSLGQALGKGLMAGQQAQQGGVTNAAQSMLLKQKMDEYKRETDLRKNYAAMFAGGTPAPNQAPLGAGSRVTQAEALSMSGMPPGPTTARAAMVGQPMPTPQAGGQQGSLQAMVAALNPAQRTALSMMTPKEGMAQMMEIQQKQVRPMTAQEVQSFGLPQGTSVAIDGFGNPSVLRQRSTPVMMDTPSGGKAMYDPDAFFNRQGGAQAPTAQPMSSGTGARVPASGGAQYGGVPPGMMNIMAPALKPEQIVTESRDWDKNYRLPVMSAIQSFSTVKDLIQNGQGGIADYGIVIKAIKALDPTSAVMQGEADSAKSMMSLADRMQSVMNQAQKGGLGSEQARMQLANLARSAVKSAVNVYNSQLERKRQFYGSKVDGPTLDAMMQQIDMPEGAESPEALAVSVGQTASGVSLSWDPATKSWIQK